MVFSKEDKALIKVLHQEKGYGAKCLSVSETKTGICLSEEVADED